MALEELKFHIDDKPSPIKRKGSRNKSLIPKDPKPLKQLYVRWMGVMAVG